MIQGHIRHLLDILPHKIRSPAIVWEERATTSKAAQLSEVSHSSQQCQKHNSDSSRAEKLLGAGTRFLSYTYSSESK
ncbi:hypothetical protein SLEP1_g51281 [Rubroshorea leprosula]|uniref:Uncharacterized protein n=1 Tax=Rubroshorea leprosula TaxID=152421 RepID=A0AAV5M461_9ROSI|nr:hypothetical protein SLEP1_g51281 [Rubroshorea leprosula]